jgi:hypothetical protein
VAGGGGGGAAVTKGDGVLPSGMGGGESSSWRGTMVAERGLRCQDLEFSVRKLMRTRIYELAAESVEGVSKGAAAGVTTHALKGGNVTDIKRVKDAEEGVGGLV